MQLVQTWQILDNPYKKLLRLLFFIILALMIGTLPFVNNFANIGGFVFGIPLAIIFLPYITFG